MNKKLYVPDRMVPKPPKNVFKIEENKNSDDPSKMEKTALERLPQPTGYRILVIPYYMKTQTKGGVYVPDATRDRESFATVAAYVVKLGASAYKDMGRFPDGAWCKEKDWIIMGRYAGNRFKVENLEVRIINDDNVIAKILDPTDISYV